MLLGGDGGEAQLGEGLGDADDGLELADCDGDGGAGVCFDFGGVDLFADGDEVGGEFFGGGFAEAGGATAGGGVSMVVGEIGEGVKTYDRQ